MLAEETLAGIPEQLINWMHSHGIRPRRTGTVDQELKTSPGKGPPRVGAQRLWSPRGSSPRRDLAHSPLPSGCIRAGTAHSESSSRGTEDGAREDGQAKRGGGGYPVRPQWGASIWRSDKLTLCAMQSCREGDSGGTSWGKYGGCGVQGQRKLKGPRRTMKGLWFSLLKTSDEDGCTFSLGLSVALSMQ